ncbi:MAG: hypothetical protein FWD29_02440 [Micrococcales bacterium]|nr:hypothetical protein [Micrococcales bacterium]
MSLTALIGAVALGVAWAIVGWTMFGLTNWLGHDPMKATFASAYVAVALIVASTAVVALATVAVVKARPKAKAIVALALAAMLPLIALPTGLFAGLAAATSQANRLGLSDQDVLTAYERSMVNRGWSQETRDRLLGRETTRGF